MIRLLTVIGHGTELLPHFIKHYQDKVDEINIVVYETDMYPLLGNEISQIIDNQNNIKIVKVIKDRIFDWEKVTQLYNFIKSEKPNDWWVIADIDEFHVYPDLLCNVISNASKSGWDIIRGGFIDRIGPDGEFSELQPDIDIFKQYPNMGFFRYPLSKACPNKICVVKGYVELTSGQHYAKIDGYTTWKWQGWNHPLINPYTFVQVHHFKWDATCIERIKSVANVKQDYAYSKEYEIMYNALRKKRFKIDLNDPEFMFESSDAYLSNEFHRYRQWTKLSKKIMSI
jgi:hypothetical protein